VGEMSIGENYERKITPHWLKHFSIFEWHSRGAEGSPLPDPFLHGQMDRFHQASRSHGSVSRSLVERHKHTEPG
jgi:hypothetical protein